MWKDCKFWRQRDFKKWLSHGTKNHISQALEYHEKFKNSNKISTFYQLFIDQKKTAFRISEKF